MGCLAAMFASLACLQVAVMDVDSLLERRQWHTLKASSVELPAPSAPFVVSDGHQSLSVEPFGPLCRVSRKPWRISLPRVVVAKIQGGLAFRSI